MQRQPMHLFDRICLILCFVAFSSGFLSAQTDKKPDARVAKALKKLDFKYDVLDNGNYKLVFDVGTQGRTQMVFIFSETYEYEGVEVREVRSIANKYVSDYPAKEVLIQLLQDNARKKFGAWELNSSDDTHYIVFSARIPATADHSVLRATLKMVLEAADEMEQQVATGDEW
jgi:hypothetical protein